MDWTQAAALVSRVLDDAYVDDTYHPALRHSYLLDEPGNTIKISLLFRAGTSEGIRTLDELVACLPQLEPVRDRLELTIEYTASGGAWDVE